MHNPIIINPPQPNIPHPLDALPFVGRVDQSRRDFWHIRPSGNYGEEFNLGADYASQFVYYLIQYRHYYVLGWIVRDMMQHNTPCGIELGFMAYLSRMVVEGTL